MTTKESLNPEEITIAVLQGGISAEREVSLNSGANIIEGLNSLDFQVKVYDAADLSFVDSLRIEKPDLVFIALHGKCGEDGKIQGLLEVLDIPYTGSGVFASALAMNKNTSKLIFKQNDLLTPKGIFVERNTINLDDEIELQNLFNKAQKELGESLVVKPNEEGSSVGVSLIDTFEDFPKALRLALENDEAALIEECIFGREITITVIDNVECNPQTLPAVEIVPKTGFYSYDNKYVAGATDLIVPARISKSEALACQELALKAHKAVNASGYSRSDIRLSDEGTPYLLEINTLPGLTKNSLVPRAAKSAGVELPELLQRFISYALSKNS